MPRLEVTEPTVLLDTAAVAELAGVSRSTVTAYRSRGRMPDPVVVLGQGGGRCPVWTLAQVEAWLAGRANSRST